MTLFPGDLVGGFKLGRLVAVQGLEGCTSPECSRVGDRCVGWHCPLCDAPTNSYGHHDCPRTPKDDASPEPAS